MANSVAAAPSILYDFSSKAMGIVSISGGPSCGKTTVLKVLAEHGHHVIHEAATDVIKNFQSLGIARPWELPYFEDTIARVQEAREKAFKATSQSFAFAERCPIDPKTYTDLFGNPVSDFLQSKYEETIHPDSLYHRCAFVLDPLTQFEDNAVRGQEHGDQAIVRKIDIGLRAGYQAAGFEVVSVPPETVAPRSLEEGDKLRAIAESATKRANIILARCGKPTIPA